MNERVEEFHIDLVHFPVRLFERSMAHIAALQREFDVVRVDDLRGGAAPARLAAMVAELDTRFVGYRATMDMLDALVDDGEDHQDVVIPVAHPSEEIATAIDGLRQLLDDVDIYCADGSELLTTATPPDLRAFRSWVFDEVTGQLRGAAPVPWRDPEPGSGARASTSRSGDGGTREPVVLRLSGALDLDDAGELRESVQAALTGGDENLLVDLRDVTFVDSVIMSVFVTTHKRYTANDRTVEFLVPHDLHLVLEMTGLVGILHVTVAS